MAKRQFMSKRPSGRNVRRNAIRRSGDGTRPQQTDKKPPPEQLKELIEHQRAHLLEAHSILLCLHAGLLYEAGDDALSFADAAKACRNLVLQVANALDSTCIEAVLDAT